MAHQSVLLNEVIEVLAPRPGEFFVDGTLDGGGHGRAILERLEPNGCFLGIDWDNEMLTRFEAKRSNFKSKLILINENYKNMPTILKKQKLGKADGILLDLGFSAEQLAAGRGFSFLKTEPLLMTYAAATKPAYAWLDTLKEKQLAEVIRNFGEERYAERIAREIKKNLPIKTTDRLVAAIKAAVPDFYGRGRLNPATRTFQALRIFVNQELENLKIFLDEIANILNPGGRLAVISFHSLEDRIVKNYFRALVEAGKAEFIAKKPIVPSRAETRENPRSRSAKLRAIQLI